MKLVCARFLHSRDDSPPRSRLAEGPPRRRSPGASPGRATRGRRSLFLPSKTRLRDRGAQLPRGAASRRNRPRGLGSGRALLCGGENAYSARRETGRGGGGPRKAARVGWHGPRRIYGGYGKKCRGASTWSAFTTKTRVRRGTSNCLKMRSQYRKMSNSPVY